jgi:hypothetical protein
MTLREVTAWLYAAHLRQSILKQPEPVDEAQTSLFPADGEF